MLASAAVKASLATTITSTTADNSPGYDRVNLYVTPDYTFIGDVFLVF